MRKIKSVAIFLVVFIFAAFGIQAPTTFAAENKVNLFNGNIESSAWNLAATLKSTKNGGTIDNSIFKDNGYFYVEYTGEKDGIQLILQSWSGGEGWAIATPNEVGVTEDNINYAKFNEDSIKAVYKSDLSTLDAIHVWNVKGGFTLKSIDYICDAGNSDIEEDNKSELKTVMPTEDNVRYLGRAYNYNDELWLAGSATGAEFLFTGTEAEITFAGDYFANGENINNARVAVYVDDELIADKMITEEESTIKAFKSEEAKTVKITIRKLSESVNGTVGIKNIKINKDGQVKQSEKKAITIEFIGDSITCGYGVEDEDCSHTFKTSTENVTKSYAYKTAKALDADLSVVSYSGYGVVSGYSGAGVKNPDQIVPKYYDKVGYSYGAFASKVKPDSITWDFNKIQPDVVVINLGTNDTNYCNSDENKADFVQGYVSFLKTVREKNPNAKILCTLGIMGDSLFDSVQKAVDDYKEETEDLNVDAMKFDVQNYSDGYAADWHPTEKTHAKAAAKLIEKIKKIMVWE